MADTFTFVPSKNFTKSITPKILNARFGDGYSQRAVDGINSKAREWDLSFINRPIPTANNIEAFFEEKNGVEAFWWTPPGESTARAVICQEWSRSYTSHISATIQARFTEVFDVL